ncbi:MAG: DUF1653 domain-containing protein [Eubacteriales bacterium]|nr:DUF1653 domain-containing protein [Eubacteriales bacterium]
MAKIEGIYRHFKGKSYEVLGEAYDTATKEYFVFYKQLYSPYRYWVRPKAMFFGDKIIENKKVKRFVKESESKKRIPIEFDVNSIEITHTETGSHYKIKKVKQNIYNIVKQ